MNFLAILGCETLSLQERIAPKSVEIDMDKQPTKFSALNVDFDDLSLDFLGSRKPAHYGINEWYSHKSRYITIVGKSFTEMVVDHHGHAAHRNKHQ